MDRQQKLKIALPILFVVMAFVWGPVIMGPGKKNDLDNNAKNINEVADGMDSAAMFRIDARKRAKTAYTGWGQNPFMLKRAPKAFYIEGIMWDEKNPKAIINGNIVGIGDAVESKTIVDIKPSSIIIKGDDGKEVELKY